MQINAVNAFPNVESMEGVDSSEAVLPSYSNWQPHQMQYDWPVSANEVIPHKHSDKKD